MYNSALNYEVGERGERIKHAALQKSSGDCLQFIYRALAKEASSGTKMTWEAFNPLPSEHF